MSKSFCYRVRNLLAGMPNEYTEEKRNHTVGRDFSQLHNYLDFIFYSGILQRLEKMKGEIVIHHDYSL